MASVSSRTASSTPASASSIVVSVGPSIVVSFRILPVLTTFARRCDDYIGVIR